MTPIFAVLMIIAVIISTSLLLILIFSEDKPKKIKKMVSNFDNAVDEFGLSIGKQELIGKRIIGLDKVKNMLLFFSATRNKQEAYFIDLREIKSCEVKREYGLTFNDYSRKNVAATDVDKIALQLFYKNGAKPLMLPFYDKKEDSLLDVELREHQVKEWRDLLSPLLRTDRKVTKTTKIPAFRTYIDAA
jgi:hypothetical protein